MSESKDPELHTVVAKTVADAIREMHESAPHLTLRRASWTEASSFAIGGSMGYWSLEFA